MHRHDIKNPEVKNTPLRVICLTLSSVCDETLCLVFDTDYIQLLEGGGKWSLFC